MYILLDIILIFINIYRIYKCKKKRISYSNVSINISISYKDKRNIVSIVSVVNIRVKRAKETVETWILSLVLKYK